MKIANKTIDKYLRLLYHKNVGFDELIFWRLVMNFISKFFVLFAMLNLLSVRPTLAESKSDSNSSNVQEAVPATSENASAEKNNDEALKPERKGMVRTYEKKMAFSYELDENGNLKNIKDLYAYDANKEGDNAENEQNKNVNICSYHQITSFEISNYGDNIIIQLAGKDEEISEESLEAINCDEKEGENESKKSEIKDNVLPKDSSNGEIREDVSDNGEISEVAEDDEGDET